MTLMLNPCRCKVLATVNASKFVLIRHLRTNFNYQISLAKKEGNPELIKAIRFGKEYIDSEPSPNHLHQISRAECLKDFDFVTIYVSPLLRALETCKLVLKLLEDSKCQREDIKIKVLPMLFEKLEDSCDFSDNLLFKREAFACLNFSGTSIPIDWTEFDNIKDPISYQLEFCDSIVEDNQIKIVPQYYSNLMNHLSENKTCESKLKLYSELLTQNVFKQMSLLSNFNENIESFKSVSRRLEIVKSQILENQNKNLTNSKKALIIGHSVLFHYWCTEKVYSSSLNPYYENNKLDNCEVIGVDLNIKI